VPGDTNHHVDIFVHDRQTGATGRISVASDGTESDGDSFLSSIQSSISADGRYVAFDSQASNLVPGDTNGRRDVFVHDRQTGNTALISVGLDGAPSNDSSSSPAISADGRYVTFTAEADNLVAGDNNGAMDIFVARNPLFSSLSE
jgi:Tol biopolymer transport system component